MTQEQRIAMRQEVIGPCTQEQKEELRNWLVSNGEIISESGFDWAGWLYPDKLIIEFDVIKWDVWASPKPIISFSEFKAKYMTP